jgi:hypothetical protein
VSGCVSVCVTPEYCVSLPLLVPWGACLSVVPGAVLKFWPLCVSFPCFPFVSECVDGVVRRRLGFLALPSRVGMEPLEVNRRGVPGLLLAPANGHPSLLCLYQVPAGRDASTGVVGMIVREVILRGGLFLSPPRWAPPRGVLACSRVGRWAVRCC